MIHMKSICYTQDTKFNVDLCKVCSEDKLYIMYCTGIPSMALMDACKRFSGLPLHFRVKGSIADPFIEEERGPHWRSYSAFCFFHSSTSFGIGTDG